MTRQKIFVSLFYHIFITIWQNKILWSSLALKNSYMTILFNKWSQSDKNVMKMWWLEISTYFLVHIIWKFPPLQNLMSDARCLDVDACLSAPNGLNALYGFVSCLPTPCEQFQSTFEFNGPLLMRLLFYLDFRLCFVARINSFFKPKRKV